jgi:hypothetical protein
MSLLTIVQTAFAELGLVNQGIPTTVVGNSDPTLIQALYLANRAGKKIALEALGDEYWQILRKQYVFQTTGVGPYTCTITPGSIVLTNLSSTSGIQVGYAAYSNGLYNDSIVTAVNAGASTVTISQNPSTSTALSGQSITFAQEAYALPSDFAYMIVQTEWDRSFRWQLLGPLNAQEWQVIKSGISPVGPRMRFRIMGNQFYINPVGSGSTIYTDNIVFEYISNAWAASSGGTAQTSFLADTDTAVIPEDLITLSLKYRILRAKGLSYQEEYDEYDEELNKYVGRDKTARNLPLNARASGIRLLNAQNVPDTGYGS